MIKSIINLNDTLFSTTYGEVFVSNIVKSDGSNVESTNGLSIEELDHITVSSHSINGQVFIYLLNGIECRTYNTFQTLFESKSHALDYIKNYNKPIQVYETNASLGKTTVDKKDI